MLGLLVLIAIIGPVLTPYDPERASLLEIMQPPSLTHWFGTNSYGADILARVIHAARLDLLIAVVSVGGGLLVAMPIGALLGYSRGWWNALVMRALDFIQSFPPFILAMALAAVAGSSVSNVILIIADFLTPSWKGVGGPYSHGLEVAHKSRLPGPRGSVQHGGRQKF